MFTMSGIYLTNNNRTHDIFFRDRMKLTSGGNNVVWFGFG